GLAEAIRRIADCDRTTIECRWRAARDCRRRVGTCSFPSKLRRLSATGRSARRSRFPVARESRRFFLFGPLKIGSDTKAGNRAARHHRGRSFATLSGFRSEERRVGKESRSEVAEG